MRNRYKYTLADSVNGNRELIEELTHDTRHDALLWLYRVGDEKFGYWTYSYSLVKDTQSPVGLYLLDESGRWSITVKEEVE